MIRAATFLALASLPAAASAQTQESGGASIELAGEAPSACVVRPPEATSGVNATLEASGGARSEIRIVQMVDPLSAEARATSFNLSLPIVCNAPHRLVLRSGNGGLLRAGAVPGQQSGGFAEFLPYEVGALWAGQEVNSRSDASGGLVVNSARGGAGQMSVSINVAAGGPPLVAGSYSDDIVIEFHVAN